VLVARYQELTARHKKQLSAKELTPAADEVMDISREGDDDNDILSLTTTSKMNADRFLLERPAVWTLLAQGETFVEQALELIDRHSDIMHEFQLDDLAEMYDRIKHEEESMHASDSLATVTEAQLYLDDAQRLLKHANLMVILAQQPKDIELER